MEETNAFLSPLLTPLPNENVMDIIRNLHGPIGSQQLQQPSRSHHPVLQSSPSEDLHSEQPLKASPSASSEISSHDGDASYQQTTLHSSNALQQIVDSASNITTGALVNSEQKPGRHDSWLECFTTTKDSEYEALLFSVYVTERSTPQVDGWTHFDCLHRLQSKCRYRLRTRKQDEFFIIEEKGVHNHGSIEPVGQPGSHAGLPKTIREIVDRSYNENWPLEARTAKVDNEIRRLGLPTNPRLGRQIDNRVAYLRRVKNLSESRRIQDQMNNTTPSPEEMLHALMEQNGGRMVVDKGIVEQMIGSKAVAALAAAQHEMGNQNGLEDFDKIPAAFLSQNLSSQQNNPDLLAIQSLPFSQHTE